MGGIPGTDPEVGGRAHRGTEPEVLQVMRENRRRSYVVAGRKNLKQMEAVPGVWRYDFLRIPQIPRMRDGKHRWMMAGSCLWERRLPRQPVWILWRWWIPDWNFVDKMLG